MGSGSKNIRVGIPAFYHRNKPMPYKSAKQRAYLHVAKPKLAAKWDRKYGGKVGGGKTKAQRKKR